MYCGKFCEKSICSLYFTIQGNFAPPLPGQRTENTPPWNRVNIRLVQCIGGTNTNILVPTLIAKVRLAGLKLNQYIERPLIVTPEKVEKAQGEYIVQECEKLNGMRDNEKWKAISKLLNHNKNSTVQPIKDDDFCKCISRAIKLFRDICLFESM